MCVLTLLGKQNIRIGRDLPMFQLKWVLVKDLKKVRFWENRTNSTDRNGNRSWEVVINRMSRRASFAKWKGKWKGNTNKERRKGPWICLSNIHCQVITGTGKKSDSPPSHRV